MCKKIIAFSLAMLMILIGAVGCSKQQDDGVVDIVCTVFPIYDWVMHMLEDVEAAYSVRLLVKNGIDAHSYQPSFEDVAAITDCDLLLRVGGDSEAWLENVLVGKVNPKMEQISMMTLLEGSLHREIVEEQEQDQEHDHDHDHEEENAYDEHVWLSVKNAETLCGDLLNTLVQKLPEHEQAISQNAQAYMRELATLDGEYEAAVKAGASKTLIFADRFPFRYLFEDYGLSYYAAFSGCEAETEASFATVKFLAEQVSALDARYVLILENGNRALAQTVIENSRITDVEILVMDSLQSYVAAEDAPSYLDVMRSNLETLKKAMA